jgi:hypothetical protein
VPPSVQEPPTQPAQAPAAFSALDEARVLAADVPCSFLTVRQVASRDSPTLSITGLALPGSALESYGRRLRTAGSSANIATTPLDPGLCPPIASLPDLVRVDRARGDMRIVGAEEPLPISARLALRLNNVPDGTVVLDLYAVDGSVHHLLHRAVRQEATIVITSPVAGAPGQRLLLAFATATPLDLGQRPATERTSTYMPILQRALSRSGGDPSGPQVDAAVLSVIAPARPAPRAAQLPSPPSTPAVTRNLSSGRCVDIVRRVQMGEALSDADRTVLRTTCRP